MMPTEGKRNIGGMNINYQMNNTIQGSGPGTVNVVDDAETSDILNAPGIVFGNSHRNVLIRESSQMSVLHDIQRSKRQNCGHVYGNGNHTPFLMNSSDGGCGSNMVNFKSESAMHQAWTSIEYNDRRHLGWKSSSRHLPSSSVEGRYSREGGVREAHWKAIFPGSEERIAAAIGCGSFAVNHNQPHLNSVPCKRKSSMLENNSSSLTFRASGGWNNDISRFVAAPGANRPESGNVALTDFSSMMPSSMGNDGLYKFDRVNPVYYQQGNRNHIWNGFGVQPAVVMPRATSAMHSSQQRMHRRISTSENMIESAGNLDNIQSEPSIISQSISYGVGIVAAGNVAFNGHGSSNSSLASMPRDANASNIMGNHGRHFRTGISPTENILPSTINRETPSLARTLSIWDSSLNVSHLSSNPYMYSGFISSQSQSSAYTLGESSWRNSGIMPAFPSIPSATPSNIVRRPQAIYGSVYPSYSSLHGTVVPSAFPGSVEGGRVSPLENLCRMPFHGLQVIPSESIIRQHRFSPHDLLNQSQVYNGVDTHDQHSNMRLDVDNMSYEELLALEERIGNVSTGLSEDVIVNCLKMTKYTLSETMPTSISQENEMKCSICQEEYTENDQIGELKCGHGYHTACIKQWLMLKNLCPICKSSAHTGS